MSSDKALKERFGGIDHIPTLFVFYRSGRETSSFVHLEGNEKMQPENLK